MARRSVGIWLAGLLVLAGCGSKPGDEELAVDHAADFAGIWYGSANTTYRHGGGTTNSASDASQLIAVTGKNALQLPQFCSASDQGVSAKVTSATHFDMLPYQCDVSLPGYCPYTVKVASGGGTLSGSTLAIDYHGTIEIPATSGCQSDTIQYDIVFSGTHTPPGQPVETPPTPENVTVSKGDWYGRFNVTWTTPNPVQQIHVQVRLGNGEWGEVTLYSSATTFVDLSFPPERTDVAFRLRSATGNVYSDWSTEVTENTGLQQPQMGSATSGGGTVQLTWTPRQDVTGLIIERSVGINMTSWTPLTTVAPGVASYTDTQVDELQSYAYRLHWEDGRIEGYPATTYPLNAGLHGPTGLVAVAGVERVDLTWQNHSALAEQIAVVRSPSFSEGFGGSDIAYLSPTATSFSDVGVATGLYRYEVQARATGQNGSSGTVPVATLPPWGSWETSVLGVPAQDLDWTAEAALDDAPRALAWSGNQGLVGSDSPAWLPHLPANYSGTFPISAPMFELDPSFHPHILWMRNTVQGTNEVAVTDEWFDGNGWHGDELVRWGIGGWGHALDASGRPVVVSSDTPSYKALRWNGSAYVVEDTGVPVSASSGVGPMVSVSPEGVIHFVVADSTLAMVHGWRDTTWKQETITAAGSTVGVNQIAASTGDRLTVVYSDWAAQNLKLVEKSAGSWGAPLTLVDSAFFADRRGLRLETSTTGKHPTLAVGTASGIQIARPGDGWTLHPLTGAYSILGVGYDASDHLYVLVEGGGDFRGTTYVAVFREK